MENFDRENIDELLEIRQIHQYFSPSKICAVRYFSATHDDKINDCGFKFSVACEWLIPNRRRQGCNSPKFSPLNS